MDLRIEIEVGSEPIRGVLHASDQAPGRHFVGWLDLVEAIAAATADPASEPGGNDPAE